MTTNEQCSKGRALRHLDNQTTSKLVTELQKEMKQAAEELNFEKAGALQDRIRELESKD